MTAALQVRGVRHRYGTLLALDGVDLTVGAGECVAPLGPNGARKTASSSCTGAGSWPRTRPPHVLAGPAVLSDRRLRG